MMLRFLPLAFALLPCAAWADLQLCNETKQPLRMSVGAKADEGWISLGWARVEAQSCGGVDMTGSRGLPSRYFRYAVQTDNPLEAVMGCTDPQRFAVIQGAICEDRDARIASVVILGAADQSWPTLLQDAALWPLAPTAPLNLRDSND